MPSRMRPHGFWSYRSRHLLESGHFEAIGLVDDHQFGLIAGLCRGSQAGFHLSDAQHPVQKVAQTLELACNPSGAIDDRWRVEERAAVTDSARYSVDVGR